MTVKIKNINEVLRKMKTLEVGTDEYTNLWSLVIEQYTGLIRKLTNRNFNESSREDDFNECILKLPDIIDAYDESQAMFSTFMVQRLRGFLQRHREKNHVIPKISVVHRSWLQKKGRTIPENVLLSATNKIGENANHEFTILDLYNKSVAPTQEDEVQYKELIDIIKTFKNHEIFLDFFVDDKPVEQICFERRLSTTLFYKRLKKFKAMLKKKLEKVYDKKIYHNPRRALFPWSKTLTKKQIIDISEEWNRIKGKVTFKSFAVKNKIAVNNLKRMILQYEAWKR